MMVKYPTMRNPTDHAPRFRQDWVWPALACLGLAFAVYFNSLGGDFLLDDFLVLFGEKGVENKSLAGLFTGYQWDFYRPAGHVFLWVCHRLFGGLAWPYHMANLVLFAVICFLNVLLVRKVSGDRALALLAGLLFAVHPINGMLVNYITASVIASAVIFAQLSFLFFLSYDGGTGRKGCYPASLLFFVLSLLSHEQAIVMPAYCVLYFIFLKPAPWQRAARVCLPYAVIAVAYLAFRFTVFSLTSTTHKTIPVFPPVEVYAAALFKLLAWYMEKLATGHGVLFLWTGDTVRPGSWEITTIGAAVMAGLVYWAFAKGRRGVLPFGLMVFLIGLAPMALASFAYYPFSEPIIEPHWFYFSSIGFFILAARGLIALRARINPKLGLALCAVLAGYLWMHALNHNALWRHQEIYCRYWLSLNAKNMTPYYGLGKSLLEKGGYDEAIGYFTRGLKAVDYYNAFILADLGYAEFLSGNAGRAGKFYEEALKMDPAYSVTHYYIGLLLLRDNDRAGAREAFRQAMRLYPKSKLYPKYMAIAEAIP